MVRRVSEGYQFEYSAELAPAIQSGFIYLADFPVNDGTTPAPYVSRRLFPIFAQRIPSRKRPDFYQLMTKLRVEAPYDDFAILAASGGRQMTDRIELFDERADESFLSVPLK